jgi:hypothetical protein
VARFGDENAAPHAHDASRLRERQMNDAGVEGVLSRPAPRFA